MLKPIVMPPLVVLTCACALSLPGCGSAPTYRGRTAAHWNQVLLDRDEQYRVEALTALGELGHDAALATPNVKRVIADKQSNGYQTRLQAVTVWWRISRNPNATVMPRLLAWLRDANEANAQFAAEALARIGPEARQALPVLRERYDAVDQKLAAMQDPERPSSNAAALQKALVEAISAVNGGA